MVISKKILTILFVVAFALVLTRFLTWETAGSQNGGDPLPKSLRNSVSPWMQENNIADRDDQGRRIIFYTHKGMPFVQETSIDACTYTSMNNYTCLNPSLKTIYYPESYVLNVLAATSIIGIWYRFRTRGV